MRRELNSSIERACRAVEQIDFADERTYAEWLAQAYYFVRHSVPLLKLSHDLAANDASYQERSKEHINEETGHEKMLLNDLKALGRKIEEFEELPATKIFYGTQYLWLKELSPHALLGYIAILEGMAVRVGEEKLKEIQNPKAATFAKLHVLEDTDHLEMAFKEIGALDAYSRDIVLKSAEVTAAIYELMAQAILESSAKRSFKVVGNHHQDKRTLEFE